MSDEQRKRESLARRLAHNDKDVRDDTVTSLRTWVAANAPLPNLEMMRLWKALFYCMWMSDKTPIQIELADNLSELAFAFPGYEGFEFLQAGFTTMRREWGGLDRFRVDKYLAFLRRMVRAVLRLGKTMKYDDEAMLKSGDALFAAIQCRPNGVRFQIMDVFTDELLVACDDIPAAHLSDVLMPFYGQLIETDDKEAFRRVCRLVVTPILRAIQSGRLPFASAGVIAADMFEVASDPKTMGSHRKPLYKLHNLGLSIAEELGEGELGSDSDGDGDGDGDGDSGGDKVDGKGDADGSDSDSDSDFGSEDGEGDDDDDGGDGAGAGAGVMSPKQTKELKAVLAKLVRDAAAVAEGSDSGDSDGGSDSEEEEEEEEEAQPSPPTKPSPKTRSQRKAAPKKKTPTKDTPKTKPPSKKQKGRPQRHPTPASPSSPATPSAAPPTPSPPNTRRRAAAKRRATSDPVVDTVPSTPSTPATPPLPPPSSSRKRVRIRTSKNTALPYKASTRRMKKSSKSPSPNRLKSPIKPAIKRD